MYTNLFLLLAAVIGGWSILRLIGAERERMLQSIPPVPAAPPATSSEPPKTAAATAKPAPPAKATPPAPSATTAKK